MGKTDLFELEKKYQSSSNIGELLELDAQYLAYLEEEIKKNPKNIQALTHLGVLSWEPFHEDQNAIEYLEKAIEYDPKNVDAHFWLATCYFHDYCAYDKARELLLKALQLDPNRSECLSLLSAIIRETSKDWDEAINYLEKAVQHAPEWPMLRFSLGSLYLQVKDIASAESQAKKIQELSTLPQIKPKNGVEEYFEAIVTGRNKKDIAESLARLNERIQKEKMEP